MPRCFSVLTMLLFCLTVSAAIAANGRDTADLNTNRLATISMISLAPSPYTLRHDSNSSRLWHLIIFFIDSSKTMSSH